MSSALEQQILEALQEISAEFRRLNERLDAVQAVNDQLTKRLDGLDD